jgi:Na+-driven multidrug efflux pump
MMGTMGFVFIFLGRQAVGMISQQPAHLELTPQLLFITGLVQVPFALSIVFRSTMHGAGDVRAVMIMTWLSTWGIRLPLAFLVSGANIRVPEAVAAALGLKSAIIANPSPLALGLPGLWMGLCGEIVVRAMIYGWRFLGGKWVRARV